MKVLVVTNMYPGRNSNYLYNGIFVKEQVEALKEKGCNVDIFIIDGFKSKFEYLKSIFNISKKINNNNYDVVHIHYGLSGLFFLFDFMRSKTSKVILTLHGGDILSAQGKSIQVYLTKKIIKKVNLVITLNDEMNKVVQSIRRDFITAPCGVNTLLFNDSGKSRKNTILFPGSKSRYVKNYPLFKSILDEYNSKNEQAEVIAVDGFNRDEVSDILSSAACIIMTSYSEGSPQIIKEALSCDLPILSLDVGDVKYLLGQTPGTKVFDANDGPVMISSYINGVIDEAQNSKGARRKRIFDLGLSQEAVIDRLLAIYKDI